MQSLNNLLEGKKLSVQEQAELRNFFQKLEDLPQADLTRQSVVSTTDSDAQNILDGEHNWGQVGGWDITIDGMTSPAGTVGMQNTADPAIFAGATVADPVDPTTGLFQVSHAGAITATSGTIAGWQILATVLRKFVSDAIGIILDAANQIIKIGDTAGNHIQIDGANNRIRSSNYVAGATGFNIDGATGNAEYNNITARGKIKTAVFEKDVISAVGGSLLVMNADVLDVDMTALDASTLTIKGDTTFTAGDILRLKDGVDDEWLEVSSAASAPTYTVTRDKASQYAANSNPIWKKGQCVVSYGQSGDGGVLVEGGTTPTVTAFTHAGSPWTTINNNMTFGENGLSAFVGTAYNAPSAIKLYDGATLSSRLWGWQNVGHNSLNGQVEKSDFSTIQLDAQTNAGANPVGEVNLKAGDPDGTPAYLYLRYQYNSGVVTGVDIGPKLVVNGDEDVTGNLDVTGTTTLGGVVTTNVSIGSNTFRGGSVTLDDDKASSFTPSVPKGFVFFTTDGGGEYEAAFYNTVGTATWDGFKTGSNTVTGTGAMTDGQGTDGKMNFHSHTDGKLYISNRRAGTRTINWVVLG